MVELVAELPAGFYKKLPYPDLWFYKKCSIKEIGHKYRVWDLERKMEIFEFFNSLEDVKKYIDNV